EEGLHEVLQGDRARCVDRAGRRARVEDDEAVHRADGEELRAAGAHLGGIAAGRVAGRARGRLAVGVGGAGLRGGEAAVLGAETRLPCRPAHGEFPARLVDVDRHLDAVGHRDREVEPEARVGIHELGDGARARRRARERDAEAERREQDGGDDAHGGSSRHVRVRPLAVFCTVSPKEAATVPTWTVTTAGPAASVERSRPPSRSAITSAFFVCLTESLPESGAASAPLVRRPVTTPIVLPFTSLSTSAAFFPWSGALACTRRTLVPAPSRSSMKIPCPGSPAAAPGANTRASLVSVSPTTPVPPGFANFALPEACVSTGPLGSLVASGIGLNLQTRCRPVARSPGEPGGPTRKASPSRVSVPVLKSSALPCVASPVTATLPVSIPVVTPGVTVTVEPPPKTVIRFICTAGRNTLPAASIVPV